MGQSAWVRRSERKDVTAFLTERRVKGGHVAAFPTKKAMENKKTRKPRAPRATAHNKRNNKPHQLRGTDRQSTTHTWCTPRCSSRPPHDAALAAPSRRDALGRCPADERARARSAARRARASLRALGGHAMSRAQPKTSLSAITT
eukprot:4860347-Prymnesium_polylepis.2